MDKSWMSNSRLSKEYKDGVDQFLKFAIARTSNPQLMRCPCRSCGNLVFQTSEEIRYHLFSKRIDQRYKTWIWHGEEDFTRASTSKKIGKNRFVESFKYDEAVNTIEMVNDAFEYSKDDPKSFQTLLEDAEKPLYPGCKKFTKLSALMRLYNIKGKYGWSDNSFSELLSSLADMLPDSNEIPSSMYEAKKTMTALGLEYEKIHACPNDCILYRNEYNGLFACPTCKTSRWMMKDKSNKECIGVPAKVLWYFPPIPRFKRMFQSSQTARDLTWHVNGREVDGKLRHPADSPSWKLVDQKWPDFATESRNLRLAISADGINPHRSLSSTYSCWPVILVTYNLPPWLCMKRKFMMLSLLISGPNQPGNDIDVYLAPLIDDLKTLWEVGIEAYDAYKQEKFTLRAILLWTINDFPAYGNLSGCVVKGKYACPICGECTYSCRLKHGSKNVYMGHRRFLPLSHPFRKQKKAFNGKQETGKAPKILEGKQILMKVDRINNSWGKKKDGKRKATQPNVLTCWKKKSIFFDLEYWKYFPVRHMLDVMHIEKNVCESIYGTLLNIKGKTKDGINSRLDLMALGLRKELAPNTNKNRTYLPPACYTLSRAEKRMFCETLYNLKVPDGYCSNFRNLVSMKDLKLQGLKSHDCHALMQQLLPLAIRSILPKHVRYAIIRLCFFFNALCNKVVDVSKLNRIQSDLVVTLCLLEKYFPPSFFDIMVHLTVHLIREVRLCGPVYLRWMYPFERFMKTLKGYVRNRNRPEGCIAECYIAEEAIEFCTEYYSNMSAVGNPIEKDNVQVGNPLPGGRAVVVEIQELQQAHHYVLQNTIEVQSYIDEHMAWLKCKYPRQSRNQKWLQDEHNSSFMNWLKQKVSNEVENQKVISFSLRWIAHGPRHHVIKCSGYDINNYRYNIYDRDNALVRQNSGVTIVATAMQIASAKDKNLVFGEMSFYGVIKEIWELDYHMFKIPVFKCDWVESNGGIKVDDLGYTLVDLNRVGHKNDCFILASQAKQVFYVSDQGDPRWSVVCSTPQKEFRHRENNEEQDNIMEHDPIIKDLPLVDSLDVSHDDNISYVRQDCEPIWVDDKNTH